MQGVSSVEMCRPTLRIQTSSSLSIWSVCSVLIPFWFHVDREVIFVLGLSKVLRNTQMKQARYGTRWPVGRIMLCEGQPYKMIGRLCSAHELWFAVLYIPFLAISHESVDGFGCLCIKEAGAFNDQLRVDHTASGEISARHILRERPPAQVWARV